MELYEREYFIARIFSGYLRHKVNKDLAIRIYAPNMEQNYEAQEIFKEARQEARKNEVMTADEILETMIELGVWTDIDEELIEKLPKDLELYLKHKESSKIYGKSELKNTCTRCGKIWYLGADELEQLEGQLTRSATYVKQVGSINIFTALFNPMLAAQGNTSLAATSGVMKSQIDELNEKSRCPECQSKNIDRVLVDGNEKIEKAPQETNKKEGSSLADELKKLSELKEQGILDEEEFKTAKRKLMES